jgi:hypothetical protein
MKKPILLLVVLSLLALPAAAAASEFTLGGYVKMETIWDSTQVNKNLYFPLSRENDASFNHGRLKFTAENTRMWFLIKGPKLWGAQTTGYIEWDFDDHGRDYIENDNLQSPHKARVGLRHAFFRLNWPETELMLGQYWSLITEEVPETANFGAATTSGFPFLREPQIRLTQTFGLGSGKMTASLALSEPENGLWGMAIAGDQNVGANNRYPGESTETPKVTGRIKYDVDLWGKAPFWGKPRPFSVRVAASWHRERFRAFDTLQDTNFPRVFGNNNYGVLTVGGVFTDAIQRDQQNLDHWIVEGSVFLPLIPTYTKNLAGTASLLAQWYVGAGLDGWIEDMPNNASYLVGQFYDPVLNRVVCDRTLMKRFGGFVQLQYYFTNEWYLNAVYGLSRAFEVDLNTWISSTNDAVRGRADPVKTNQQFYLCLWYRPITALKFGLEYTYYRTDYFQNTTAGTWTTNLGEDHRVMFCGFFFF